MKTEQQYFEEAILLQDYMEKMETHKENTLNIYEQFNIPKDDEFIQVLKEKNPHVLVITEDWCGDAMMNNPVLRRIAEAAGIEVRCVYRDQNLDLMDRYLTNGGRSIPVYLLLSQEGEVLTKWGPRAPKVQEFVTDIRKDLPPKEDPSFQEKQKEVIGQMTEQYKTNEEFWLWVYEDIRKEFMPAVQKMS